MTLRVGVIGVGAIGHIHAENLATRVPSATLAAVADTNAAAGRAIAERFGVPLYDNHRKLLADPHVDAVAICTLRPTHVPMIIEAATAGKHIFCEKPLASTVAEVDEALAAVERAGVQLQIGFNRRFDRNFLHVRETVAAGTIGETRIIHIVSRDPAPANGGGDRAPEDLVLETTIHDFDVARYLAGGAIESVFATGIPSAPGRLEGAVFTLRFASGVVTTIDNHLMSAAGYDQRVEVFGTRGEIAIANETAHLATLSDAAGVSRARPLYFFAERYADSYIAEMEAFARSVVDGTPSPVNGADGRAALTVAEAALESLREGRPVLVRG